MGPAGNSLQASSESMLQNFKYSIEIFSEIVSFFPSIWNNGFISREERKRYIYRMKMFTFPFETLFY